MGTLKAVIKQSNHILMKSALYSDKTFRIIGFLITSCAQQFLSEMKGVWKLVDQDKSIVLPSHALTSLIIKQKGGSLDCSYKEHIRVK